MDPAPNPLPSPRFSSLLLPPLITSKPPDYLFFLSTRVSVLLVDAKIVPSDALIGAVLCSIVMQVVLRLGARTE